MSLEGKSPEEVSALAALADSVLNNKKTRSSFQRLLKEGNPNISIPEVDIEDRVNAAVKPHVDEMEKMKAKEAQNEAERQVNLLYETLRDDRVCANRTQFSDLVKYAHEKGFQTTEGGLRMAASHRDAEQKSAEPTPQSAAYGTFDFHNAGEAHKDLMKDPRGWALQKANESITEFQKKRA